MTAVVVCDWLPPAWPPTLQLRTLQRGCTHAALFVRWPPCSVVMEPIAAAEQGASRSRASSSSSSLSSTSSKPELSVEAMLALSQFFEERDADTGIGENYGLSQFWYDDRTAEAVAREAVEHARGGRIACLSCPSAFKAIKVRTARCAAQQLWLRAPQRLFPEAEAYNFEFDRRFGALGSFVFYDFNYPESLPEGLLHSCAYVIADPPYLVRGAA